MSRDGVGRQAAGSLNFDFCLIGAALERERRRLCLRVKFHRESAAVRRAGFAPMKPFRPRLGRIGVPFVPILSS